MEQYLVTGMSCAACSARVEKAVNQVPGVSSCTVSLLTNSMGVEGTADPAAVIQAVQDAGYDASKKGSADSKDNTSPSEYEEMLKSKVADLKNMGGPNAGTIAAALFLREFVEDRIADVLDRVQANESFDAVEKKVIKAGIKAGITYFCNACPLDDDKLDAISETIVEKGINKINPALSKQLRK